MADLRKPVFVADTAVILGCTKKAEYLFQYDEAEAAPIQITNGLGAMPPEDSYGKYQIWTDTFTLGMTSLEEASPIFYSADSNSDEDILVGVNTIAGRLGLSLQTNVTVGKTWLEGLGEVYVHALGADPSICDPNVFLPMLGYAAPGGLSSSLYFIQSGIKHIGAGSKDGISVPSFGLNNLTVSYACTLAHYKSTDHINSTHWMGYADGLYTTGQILQAYDMLQVGDVVYRDVNGNNYYPENHGFMINSNIQVAGSIRDSINWVSIGANGVVLSVVPMNTL